MSIYYQKLAEDNPLKYPSRMGKLWDKDEVLNLLKSIESKKTIHEIAVEHERTDGAVNSQLRKMAADYWFNEKKSIEEIIKITSLTKEEIEDTIKRRTIVNDLKKDKEKEIKAKSNVDIIQMSIPIKEIVELKAEVESLKKDMKEMLRIINLIYEFESK